MVGRRLAQYRIEERLGKGGMGTVYRAVDTRLEREVAVKILSRSEGDDDELARLLSEARAAASLNHPAIATIHEVGEVEGLSFIVMELVEGLSLRESRAGATPAPRELARMGSEIAAGLQVAHEQGVIHGDIKLDNLMLGADDGIRILDFGVARRVSRADVDATLDTGDVGWGDPGSVSGTLAYMAPEQLRGERIDGRADLYSLGVVLHELATGKRPHEAETPVALIAQVLSEAAAPLQDLARDQPAEFGRIVRKLLAKNPDERFRSAREVETDLDRFARSLEQGEPVAREPHRSVAVLPFQLLAGSAEDEFLRVALAESVAHGLSQNTELVVRPTSAVMRHEGREIDPQQVAHELNVQVVVEGSIQKLGSQLRVQVQAWESTQRSTLLSVKRDGPVSELFDLQDRLADDLAKGLGVEEGPSAATEPPTRDPRAYEGYLRAGERLLRYSQRGTMDAIEMLRAAVKLDMAFAAAWARLAAATVTMGTFHDPDRKWFVEAEQAVDRALALDPTSVQAWSARGRILWSPHHDFRHTEALRAFAKTRARPSRPHDAPLWEGLVLLHVGLHAKARSCLLEALEGQPDDLLVVASLGETEAFVGDHEAAQEYFDRGLALEPSSIWGNLFVPIGLLQLGELDKAERALTRAREIVGEDSLLRSAEALLWAKRGEARRAEEHVRLAIDNLQSVSHAHHTRHYVAAALAVTGQPERSLEQLRLAADSGLPNYPLFAGDKHFASLRTRPDHVAFLADLKLGWEALRREFVGPSSGNGP